MKVIKKIDDLGRISIPRDMRRNLNIFGGDELSIECTDDKIVITPVSTNIQNQINDIREKFYNWVQSNESNVDTQEVCDALDNLIKAYNQMQEKIEKTK